MTPNSESHHAGLTAKPRGPQFSLRGLFVATVAISLVLALIVMTQRYFDSQEQVKQQAAELTRLRAEAGYLVVGEPAMVHVLAMPTHEDNVWKWKVYLPPHSQWQMHTAVGKIRAEGFDNQGKMTFGVASGDLTIEAFFQRDAAGDPKLCVSIAVGNHSETIGHSVPAEIAEELFSTKGRTFRQSGKPVAAVGSRDEQVELLRTRRGSKLVYQDETTESYEVDDGPTTGALIWLERVP